MNSPRLPDTVRAMRRTLFTVAYLGLGLALGMVAVAPSKAQQADEMVRFKITNPSLSAYKLAIPVFQTDGDPGLGKGLQEIMMGDLRATGTFQVLDPHSFVASGHEPAPGLELEPDWEKNSGGP